MTKNEIQLLKSKIDNGTVTHPLKDAEEVVAKILSVSEDEQDVIYDIVSSSKTGQVGKANAVLAHFNEIDAVFAA